MMDKKAAKYFVKSHHEKAKAVRMMSTGLWVIAADGVDCFTALNVGSKSIGAAWQYAAKDIEENEK